MVGEEIPCPLCKQTINLFGDHATCCTKNGDLIVRHNALRNLSTRSRRMVCSTLSLRSKASLAQLQVAAQAM